MLRDGGMPGFLQEMSTESFTTLPTVNKKRVIQTLTALKSSLDYDPNLRIQDQSLKIADLIRISND